MKCYVIKTLTANRVLGVTNSIEKAKNVIEEIYSKMNGKNGKCECHSINKTHNNKFKVNTVYTDEFGGIVSTQIFEIEETEMHE